MTSNSKIIKKIAVIDSPERKIYWENLSEYISVSEKPENKNVMAFVLSQDFLGESVCEVMEEIKKIPVPVAIVTSDISIENQKYLCGIGADDIICMSVCEKLLLKKICSLTSSVPNLAEGQLIDFGTFSNIEETNSDTGAYTINSGGFAGIYRFVIRLLERLDKSAQLIIFNLDYEHSEKEEIRKVMKVLSDAVRVCLRRGDISSVFGENQIMIILIGADDIGGHLVANRIVSNFYSKCDNTSFRLSYNIRDIKPIN